jgi:hypothetical protein
MLKDAGILPREATSILEDAQVLATFLADHPY